MEAYLAPTELSLGVNFKSESGHVSAVSAELVPVVDDAPDNAPVKLTIGELEPPTEGAVAERVAESPSNGLPSDERFDAKSAGVDPFTFFESLHCAILFVSEFDSPTS